MGIASATASPAAAYAVGQYFKGLAQENLLGGKTETAELTAAQETARAVAHGVIAAATAAAGDNNALTAAISAGGAEAAAPYVSQWLYGEKDGSKLTAEQKQTVSNILSLGGAAVGVTGGSTADTVAGGQAAQRAVENNQFARRATTNRYNWTASQIRQHEMASRRIQELIERIRKLEPNFKGRMIGDPSVPLQSRDVAYYQRYLNNLLAQNGYMPIGNSSWTYLSRDFRNIIREVEQYSGSSLPANQRNALANDLKINSYRLPVSDVRYSQLQREYNSSRNDIIRQWEVNTGQKWPKGYQAHHIVPMRYGGQNVWWNIQPISSQNHQSGVHGRTSETQMHFPTPLLK